MPQAEPRPGQALSGDAAEGHGTSGGTSAPAAGDGHADAGGNGNREKEHVAASLLDILAQPDSAINPHIRAMALDALQALLPEIGTPGFLRTLARRLCLMERPPASLLRTLLSGNDREIVGTLLLDARMPESLLVEIAERSGPEVLGVLARRRRLSTAVCNALLKRDDPEVMLELLRNRNAVIEEHGYWAVLRRARHEPGLHAPLVTREDLPAAVAFDLFWHLPPMQRRFVISRFVSDSDMLDRILRIARPAADGLDATDRAMHIETMISMICDGETEAAARRLSRLTGMHPDACGRIVSDASGEGLTITLKALGLQRRVFTDVIERIRSAPAAPLDGRRDMEELRILFDTLSTNKSWVMLTYWDWSARGIGPYSDREEAAGDPRGVALPGAEAETSGGETVPAVESAGGPERRETSGAAPHATGPEPVGAAGEMPADAEKEEPSAKNRGEPEGGMESTKGPERPEAEESGAGEATASPSVEEGEPDGTEAERDGEEDLPDDPLARIDALLRQLQRAARGGDDREGGEREGKVA